MHCPPLLIAYNLDGAEKCRSQPQNLYIACFLLAHTLEEWLSSVKINTKKKNVMKINIGSETPNYKILPFIVLDLLSVFFGLLQFPNNENRPPLCGRTRVPLTCLQSDKRFLQD